MSAGVRTEDTIAVAFFTALVGMLLGFVIGMNWSGSSKGYFYVASSNIGYSVDIDTESATTMRVTDYVSLDRAQKLCDEYNRELDEERAVSR